MIRDDQIARMMGAGALALLLGALGFQYLDASAALRNVSLATLAAISRRAIGLIGTSVWKWNSRSLVIGTILLVAVLAVIVTGQLQNIVAITFAAAALIALAFWIQDARLIVAMTIVLVAVSGLIGAYQTGMQIGILPGPSACTVAQAYVMGSGAPRAGSQLQCRDLEPVRPVAGGLQCASSPS